MNLGLADILFYLALGLMITGIWAFKRVSNTLLMGILAFALIVIFIEPYFSQWISLFPPNLAFSSIINAYELMCILLGQLIAEIKQEGKR